MKRRPWSTDCFSAMFWYFHNAANNETNIIWTVSSEKSSFGHAQIVQIHIILHMRSPIWSPLTHSKVSNDSVCGQWRPWSDCASAQSDLGPRCPHMNQWGLYNRFAKSLIRAFALHWNFYSIQWFCKRSVKALITLRTEGTFLLGGAHIIFWLNAFCKEDSL